VTLSPQREWAVAVFVVWRGAVLLHRHERLGRWLPVGGHVEPGETPDEAAVRETLEESGVAVELIGPPPIAASGPRQLTRPRGVQLERIDDAHEHVDLVYLGRPSADYDGSLDGPASLGWYSPSQLSQLPLSEEIAAWCALALTEVDDHT